MLNPFERHNIKHLSPSSLQTYQANPSLWVGRYLLKWADDAGPKAWVGNAVEAGLASYLGADEVPPLQAALRQFEEKAAGDLSENVSAARAEIEPMLKQACDAMQARKGSYPTYQQRVEWFVDGIEVPIIGYKDFQFLDASILDLKTTRAMPSSPKTDHAAQVGFYMIASKVDVGELLYVTPKKSALYTLTIEQAHEAVKPLLIAAKAVRSLLNRVETGEDALSIFAPNFDDFRWSDSTKTAALQFHA